LRYNTPVIEKLLLCRIKLLICYFIDVLVRGTIYQRTDVILNHYPPLIAVDVDLPRFLNALDLYSLQFQGVVSVTLYTPFATNNTCVLIYNPNDFLTVFIYVHVLLIQ
jgi:hypothetical protein